MEIANFQMEQAAFTSAFASVGVSGGYPVCPRMAETDQLRENLPAGAESAVPVRAEKPQTRKLPNRSQKEKTLGLRAVCHIPIFFSCQMTVEGIAQGREMATARETIPSADSPLSVPSEAFP